MPLLQSVWWQKTAGENKTTRSQINLQGGPKKSALFCFSSSFLLKQHIMKIFSPNNASMMGNYVLQF